MYFCPKQGQDFKPPAAPQYPNMGQVPPPPGCQWPTGTVTESMPWENNTNQLNALAETPAGIIKLGTLHSTENSR